MPSKVCFVNTVIVAPDLSRIVLMHKLQGPEGVAGRINFPGGKLEAGETALAAASREDLEEVGLVIPESAWTVVDFFDFGHAELTTVAGVSPDWRDARTCTNEPVFNADMAFVLRDCSAHPERYAMDFLMLLERSLSTLRAAAEVSGQPVDPQPALPGRRPSSP